MICYSVTLLKISPTKADHVVSGVPGEFCTSWGETNWSDDPPRKLKPKAIGDFGLHGSVRARLTGRFAVNVTQVMVSSKWLETGA